MQDERCSEKWVRYWARKYSWMICSTIDLDDIQQAVRMGIFRANQAYMEAVGSWANYSSYFIKNELRRLKFPSIAVASLDAPLSVDDDTTLHDIVPDDSVPEMDSILVDEEKKLAVRDAVERLPDQQRDLIKRHYFDDKAVLSIAADLGISADRAYKLMETARHRLRRDRTLRALVDELAWQTYTLSRFRSTQTSVVEWAVITAERKLEKMKGWETHGD